MLNKAKMELPIKISPSIQISPYGNFGHSRCLVICLYFDTCMWDVVVDQSDKKLNI